MISRFTSTATRRSPRPIPCNNPAIVSGASKLLSWPLSMIFMKWEVRAEPAAPVLPTRLLYSRLRNFARREACDQKNSISPVATVSGASFPSVTRVS